MSYWQFYHVWPLAEQVPVEHLACIRLGLDSPEQPITLTWIQNPNAITGPLTVAWVTIEQERVGDVHYVATLKNGVVALVGITPYSFAYRSILECAKLHWSGESWQKVWFPARSPWTQLKSTLLRRIKVAL